MNWFNNTAWFGIWNLSKWYTLLSYLYICLLFLTSLFVVVNAADFYVVHSDSWVKSLGYQSFRRECLMDCFLRKHIRKLFDNTRRYWLWIPYMKSRHWASERLNDLMITKESTKLSPWEARAVFWGLIFACRLFSDQNTGIERCKNLYLCHWKYWI